MSLLWVHASGGQPLYHGTAVYDEDGPDEITPGRESSWNVGAGVSPEHAYATSSLSDAWHYAEAKYRREGMSWSRPVVYRVTPTGPVEQDPQWENGVSRGNFASDVRSRHPFVVEEEVEHPDPPEEGWHCQHCGSIDHQTSEHEPTQVHASANFVTLYRGLDGVHPDDVDHGNLGEHWSHDPNDAYNFALHQGDADLTGMGRESDPWGDDEPVTQEGTVLEAQVHPRHLIEYDDPEWEHHEISRMPWEVRVRPGAPVHVQKVRHVTMDEDGFTTETEHPAPTRSRA